MIFDTQISLPVSDKENATKLAATLAAHTVSPHPTPLSLHPASYTLHPTPYTHPTHVAAHTVSPPLPLPIPLPLPLHNPLAIILRNNMVGIGPPHPLRRDAGGEGATPESSKGSPKVNFLLQAVVFQSQNRAYARCWRVLTPPPL